MTIVLCARSLKLTAKGIYSFTDFMPFIQNPGIVSAQKLILKILQDHFLQGLMLQLIL